MSEKQDVITRIEEENKTETSLRSSAHLRDEDFEVFDDQKFTAYNVLDEWEKIMELYSCHKILIPEKAQEKLGVVVGMNISQEFPWKQIKFKYLANHLFENIENGEAVRKEFSNFSPDELVLLGYCPLITQSLDEIPEEDPFLIFTTRKGAKEASEIIKEIEKYERWAMNNALHKKPRFWRSVGSEAEIERTKRVKEAEPVVVEVQSLYPMAGAAPVFKMRLSTDVRDGYVELVPGDKKYENVYKKRIDAVVQSAPDKFTVEQQTDPTFPTNAWSQYLYEVDEGNDGLDASDDEEEDKIKAAGKKTPTPEPPKEKAPLEMSDQIKMLLEILEFNQIDMYKNDYIEIFPNKIQKYSNPFLEELLCFSNIEKSQGRFVCSSDWYTNLSGLIVLSYTFSTLSTEASMREKIDEVQREILARNPVLMWNFRDSLNYKFELRAAREVTCLSFCPYDENILLGGTRSGQIIMWDLLDKVKKLDVEEILSNNQTYYRYVIREFLNWTIQKDEGTIVLPAFISALEGSQTSYITSIKWLNRNYYMTPQGKVLKMDKAVHRFFLTTSFDGTIAFWSLDTVIPRKGGAAAKPLPKRLQQSESIYKPYDKILKPLYIINFPERISVTLCDEAQYSYEPQVKGNENFTDLFPIKVTPTSTKLGPFRQNIIGGSLLGHIEMYEWMGTVQEDSKPNKETIPGSRSFGRVHDGMIVAIERNPFIPEIFASIGRNIFAIWREDYQISPILWRYNDTMFTYLKWSQTRPAVFYITRNDGVFEAWDLIEKDNEPIFKEVLGGGIMTHIAEHRPKVPSKYLGVGDYNSSFRLLQLPDYFNHPIPHEKERFTAFVEHEIERKKSVQQWEAEWIKKNAEMLEAKKNAAIEAAKELEKAQRDAAEMAAKKARFAEAQAAKLAAIAGRKKTFNLPDVLEKKFDEMNIKRMMNVLMTRKMVNAESLEKETRLEKERLKFEEEKKKAIKQSSILLQEEVLETRAKILVKETIETERPELVKEFALSILKGTQAYTQVDEACELFIEESFDCEEIPTRDFVGRGVIRRLNLNCSLGGNHERPNLFEKDKKIKAYEDYVFGFEDPFEDLEEEYEEEQSESMAGSNVVGEESRSSIIQVEIE